MKRPLTMDALCALALLTWVDARRQLRFKSEKAVHKKALKTWEDEGGALR